jgi:hypothetical protein
MQSELAHAADKAQGGWAYNYEEGYWSITDGSELINGKTFGGPLIGIAMTEKSAKDICDAHNASITAKREKAKQDGWYEGRDHERKLIAEEIQQLREQLAADRKQWEATRDELQRIIGTNVTQLATAQAAIERIARICERGAHADAVPEIYSVVLKSTDTAALDVAIAAAQKPLVDALKRIADGEGMPSDTLQSIAEHALAKVMEQQHEHAADKAAREKLSPEGDWK